IQILVRVQAPLLPVLPQMFGEGMTRYLATYGWTDPDGSVVVPLTFEHEDAACGRLLGLGPLAEVLEPASMREKIVREVTAIQAVYARASHAVSEVRSQV